MIVLEILDRNNIRVPCAHIPSVDCPDKCYYGKDLPANMCDKEFQRRYPELDGIIEGQNTCTNKKWSMPFQGTGQTPNGMKEYVLNMGPKVKVVVKLKILLRDCLEIIKGNRKITANNFSAFNNIGEIDPDLFEISLGQPGWGSLSGSSGTTVSSAAGGGKNKKSKKRRSKTKRIKYKKHKTKKKRSKKRRSRKY